MIVTEENEIFYLQAIKVDFLTEKWEVEKYMTALMMADAWGKEIDKKNKEYLRQNNLIDKYNI